MADAEIKIKTIDETGSGFQSVATRFKNFDEQVGNLEKNLRPLEEILKAGTEASGVLSGLGALGKNSGNITAAFGDLQGAFLGVKGAAEQAGESLGIVGTAMKGLMNLGAKGTQIFAGLTAALEVGKQLKVGYVALRTVVAEMNAIQKAAAASTAALASAQAGATVKTGLLTTATQLWNYALAVNPLFAWMTAITTATAVIGALAYGLYSLRAAEEEYGQAAEANLKRTREQNQANERRRGLLDAQIESLKLMAELERNDDARKQLAELEKHFGSLGAEIDETTGKIKNLDEVLATARLKQAQEKTQDVSQELKNLKKAKREQEKRFKESKVGWFGGTTEGSEKEKKKLDDLRAQIEDAKKRLQDAKNDELKISADEKKRQEAEKQEKQRKQEETARQMEASKRAEDAKAAQETQRKATEKARLEAEAKRKADAEAAETKRRNQEIQGFQDFRRETQAQERRDQEREQDKRWDAMKPEDVVKEVEAKLALSGRDVGTLESEYEKKLQEFSRDGFLSDEEKETLKSIQESWRNSVRDRDRYQSRLDQARNRLKDGTKTAQEIARSGPVETVMRGSVEALKKETALFTPKETTADVMRKAEKRRSRQAQKSIELQEESNKIAREKNEFVGV